MYFYHNRIQKSKKICSVNSTDIPTNDIQEETLKEAADMFIYLNSCTKTFMAWIDFYRRLFNNSNPPVVLLMLNRLILKAKNEKQYSEVATVLLERSSSYLKNNIDKMEKQGMHC